MPGGGGIRACVYRGVAVAHLMRLVRIIAGALWVVCVCTAFAMIALVVSIDELLQREP